MKSYQSFSLILFITVLLFSSCSNSKLPDDSLKQVPEDVTSVTAFNINSLMAKADYEYIKGLDFFQEGMTDLQKEKPALAAIMQEPFTSGIDLTKNAYLIMDVDKDHPSEKQFGAFVFSINDAALFQKMMVDLSEKQPIDHSDYLMLTNKDGQAIAWNATLGMIVVGNSSSDNNAYVQSYFDKDRTGSIADNSDLTKCLAKDYDMASWINSNAIAENPQLKTAAAFMGIGQDVLAENYFHSYVNFEKGFIKGNTEHFLQKELTNDLQLFFKNKVSEDLSKYIPNENLGMAFSSALDTRGIYQIISEKAGGLTAVNAGLKKYGFTSNDLAKALGGDFLVAVYSNQQKEEKPTGLLTGTIGDKKLFDQFLDLGQQFEVLVPEGNDLYRLKNGPKDLENAYLLIQDDLFFVSNAKAMLGKIQEGGYPTADQIPEETYTALTNNAFGAIMNFENLTNFENDFKDLPFENARMNAGLESSTFQMDLENKEVNSLKAFFEMMNDSYKKNKTREAAVSMEI